MRILSNIGESWTGSALALALRRHSMTISGWPYSTGVPSSTRMLGDLAGARRDDFVEGLHRLDQQQLVAGLDDRADLDERLGFRARPQIGGADHRRFDRAGVIGGAKPAPARRSRAAARRDRARRTWVADGSGAPLARHTHPQAVMFDFDLAEVVTPGDLRERRDDGHVEGGSPCRCRKKSCKLEGQSDKTWASAENGRRPITRPGVAIKAVRP